MTPLWRYVTKSLLSASEKRRLPPVWSRMDVKIMALARAFDVAAIARPALEIGQEIARSSTEDYANAGYSLVDLGEAAILPAPVTFIDFGNAAVLFSRLNPHRHDSPAGLYEGAAQANLFMRWSDGSVTEAVAPLTWPETPSASVGEISYQVIVSERDSDLRRPMEALLLQAMGAITIINSRAAVRQPIEDHRGVARLVRQAGVKLSPGIVHTRVTLGDPRGGGEGAEGPHHPRAYHFCRAHLRHKATGRIERVRAHWRGDPAFGVRLPSYVVRSEATNEP